MYFPFGSAYEWLSPRDFGLFCFNERSNKHIEQAGAVLSTLQAWFHFIHTMRVRWAQDYRLGTEEKKEQLNVLTTATKLIK